MNIIGITGTIGAGKGTIVEYLKSRNYYHYSARNFLLKKVAERKLPAIRDNINLVANDLRKQHFPGYIIGELLKEAQRKGQPAVIESVRAIGEVELLKQNTDKQKFFLFAADADIQLRYTRIVKRGSSTDHISFEKFVEDENKELNAQEAWNMNIKACMAQADYCFVNSGSVHELYDQVERVLQNLEHDRHNQ